MTKEKVTIAGSDAGNILEVVKAADVPAKPEAPKPYDFTLAKHLARDLRNYHDGVAVQIAEQKAGTERNAIIAILNDMNDELEALEKYVGETSAKSELAEAESALKAAQDKVKALKG